MWVECSVRLSRYEKRIYYHIVQMWFAVVSGVFTTVYYTALFYQKWTVPTDFKVSVSCCADHPKLRLMDVCGLRACTKFSHISALRVSRLDRESRPFSGIVSGFWFRSVELCGLADQRHIVVDAGVFNSNYSPVPLGPRVVTVPRYRVIPGLTFISTYYCLKKWSTVFG